MVVFCESSACSTCKTAQGARRNTTGHRGKPSASTSGYRPESSIIGQKLWSVGTILGRPAINGRDQQNADIYPPLNLIPYKRFQLRSFSQFHTDLLQMEEFLAQNLDCQLGRLEKAELPGFRYECTIHAELHSAALSVSPRRGKDLESCNTCL
ncbi:hypothetical protein CsSME_00011314 [Camellia sinensis var. sinensis]